MFSVEPAVEAGLRHRWTVTVRGGIKPTFSEAERDRGGRAVGGRPVRLALLVSPWLISDGLAARRWSG